MTERSTSSAGDSPVRTSRKQASEPALRESDLDSSSTSPGSQTSSFDPGAGFSSRMWRTYSPVKTDEISPSLSLRWGNSGFTTSPGDCWTLATSEWPSGGGESSSLRDVLEADVPPRFFLSQKAAAGILRRAENRRRVIPPGLKAALLERSGAIMPAAATTTESSTPVAISENQRAYLTERPFFRTTNRKGGKAGQGYQAIRQGRMLRRLTPTECERLQGFPDGWTVI